MQAQQKFAELDEIQWLLLLGEDTCGGTSGLTAEQASLGLPSPHWEQQLISQHAAWKPMSFGSSGQCDTKL